MAPTGVSCHHQSQQTDCSRDFRCLSPFVLATKLKMPIFRLKNNTKNYTYLSSIFNPNICSKIKSLHLQQTSRSDLGISPAVSLSPFSIGLLISHFIRPSFAYLKLPLSRPTRILGNPPTGRA